jgi:[CysO sulfur-carrier protein]-S-L-cysteine hydrolase
VVVVPPAIRAELRAHAEEEAPNECCGLVLLRDGVAVQYIRGVNRLASPYRYELYVDPVVWSELDDDLEQVIFHSHPETEPRPSRTDRELAGLWAGKPFLIYGLARDELRAWRFSRDEVEELELVTAEVA